jgi:quercetin dioxygenase-like cupin family protein
MSTAASKYFVTKPECSRHQIFPGVFINTVAGENTMISIVELEPRAEVLPHKHPHEQMGLLLSGELTFTIGDETRTIKPGEMWRIPGGVVHGCIAGSEPTVAIDVFNPIREDYR